MRIFFLKIGVPPLLLAAIRGRREIAAVLLDRGADPNVANKVVLEACIHTIRPTVHIVLTYYFNFLFVSVCFRMV